MRIAIDGRALLGQSTGIGTYTRGIARALIAQGHEAALFAPRALPPGAADGIPVFARWHPSGTLWAQVALPRAARRFGADILLAALTIAPRAAETPVASVVHDLTAWTHPEWHARRTVAGFLPNWERTAERAACLLCVSQTTARELLALYPETAPRVRVAENGVDEEFAPGGDSVSREAARRRFAGGNRFVLYLGTLEPRKNIGALVAACERLWAKRRARPDLVLAGGMGWKTSGLLRRIARSPFRDKIHLTGYASREAAVALYRAAEVFVYPSLSEGFGLPVAEAMACGTPVVISTADALREVAGDAALAAPPRDVAELARCIERALEDSDTRERLRAEGPARARRYSWENAGARTAAALSEAVAGAHR
ncbi:MAG TPA: glycosyltransferase family 1 protein [Thermoanaerobaculia bacterium]